MKKSLFFLPILLAVILAFTIPAAPASAQIDTDAGVSARIGLLPSSKFYFLKEWGRSIERSFTRKPITRAELELRILDEKALELRTLEEKKETEEEAYKKGLLGYEKTKTRLVRSIADVPPEEARDRVDALIERIKDHLLLESDIIESLEIRFVADEEFQKEIEDFRLENLLFEEGVGLDFEEGFFEKDLELEEPIEIKENGELPGLEEDLDTLLKEDLEPETKIDDPAACGPLPGLAAPPVGCDYTIKCVNRVWDVKLVCANGPEGI